jgi:hypothetical protein
MTKLPFYTKILTLGSAYTDNALVGEVIIEEKIDGSQFRWGLDDNGELVIGTKGTIINHPDENKMFKQGAEYILSIADKIKEGFSSNTYFYGEYLQKPKHNVLSYEKVPKNHIILFDVVIQGKFMTIREDLENFAEYLGIDVVPEIFRGELHFKAKNGGYSNPVDLLKRFIETTPSYLGNELIEGIVIKNYGQTIILGGHVFPLFTKYVRENFKERHDVEWKSHNPKETLQDYIAGFKNENRWLKAVLHLKDKGVLTRSPKDIGALLKEIQNDILEEETENIKNYLFKTFKEDILRNSIKGTAEWYKEKLLEDFKNETLENS